ncbi:MAG: exodeoxyribonuclease VII large subunit [Erysipelotrichaceae bacterium]|nr:exodeoxyribonuclease VII large subunit [Erysipelotrichaceae bacterium]
MQQLSVSSLLRYLKNRLDTDDHLQKIYVSGEISNYHRHFSGHLYFTLKDQYAAISCVMFKSAAASLRFEPKTGDKVLVYANTSIFEASGQLQLYVQKMSLDGLGDLYARYEALRNKLNEEGYFDSDHKKILQKTYPENVGVLVGDKSAAMSDIKTAFQRRWPLCKVTYFPVLVQGPDAPKDIIEKLLQADQEGFDAIILARGGGSFEDLFCFNDEQLVKTIFAMKTFLISGIGHEQDFTLADFVADRRAATPTAAVELITPDIEKVKSLIDDLTLDLHEDVLTVLERKKMSFDFYSQRLFRYMDSLSSIQERIDACIAQIKSSILHKCDRDLDQIIHLEDRMAMKLDFRLNEARLSYKRFTTLLEAYNAENVLKRGYTIVFQDDRVIKNKKDLKPEGFEIRFADGIVKAKERD